MLGQFRRGVEELGEIWKVALRPETLAEIRSLAASDGGARAFRMDDFLWAKTVIEFAVAYEANPMLRSQLVRSLTPLYLGRVASFVQETETLSSPEVEECVERACLVFEELKPYLIALWEGSVEQPAGALEAENA
jgi:hypothetical protein